MKNVIAILCGMILGSTAYSQTLEGRVVDKNQVPIENASIILNTVDSLYVGSCMSDSLGNFSMPLNVEPPFRLIVQHLLYQIYDEVYSRSNGVIIELAESEESILSEAFIKGEKPLVKLIEGKLTYDIPRLIEGKVVNSAYESLLQLPGVREENGTLILAGASKVTVIINGQVTTMPYQNLMAALKMYPASMIQSAEVMYSTPPQYHVRGASINLTIKQAESNSDSNGSLQGQVNAIYSQKHYANYTTGASLLYSKSKFNADFNYSYNLDHEKTGVDIFSNHLYGGVINYVEQLNSGDRKSNKHNFRIGTGYKLSEKDKINLTYTGQLTHGVNNNEASEGTFSSSKSHKEEDTPIQLHNLLLNYSSGFGMSLGAEYTYYKDNMIQQFEELMLGKEDHFIADSKQAINRYRFYVDQAHSLKNSWKINYGAQYMYATDHSSQIYQSLVGNNMSNSNTDSELSEHTTNLYVGFKKSIGSKLSLSASISGEYYKLEDYDEWTVFPTFEATYIISPTHIMQLSLSSDKEYPSYWEMHGAIGYLNGYAEVHGNPLLKPYKSYSTQFSYLFKSKYILNIYYNYLDDYSAQLPYQAQDRLALIYKTQNFDYKQVLGINLIVPFKIGKVLSSRLTLSGFYDKVKSSHFYDISFMKDNVVFYSKLDNTINVSSKPNIKMEISGSYISENIQGPAELTDMWNIDFGVKWVFLSELAELRLKGSDLLNSWSPDMTMRYNVQNLRMNIMPDSRNISLSFTYKFGGYNKSLKEFDSSRFGTR